MATRHHQHSFIPTLTASLKQCPQPLSRPEVRQSKKAASPSPSPSPPPAPVASKRRRFMDLIEEGEKKNEEVVKVAVPEARKRRLVKKLGDDFDRVASSENEGSDAVDSDSVAMKTRRRRLVKLGDAVKKVVDEAEKSNSKANKSEAEKSPVSGKGVRTSPRLAKRGSK
ncbi:hypothetical protein SESBI_05413 [Sesbania bispinosa]|nr:hypothetical protein SESBI_05413 [Sesbania bispinosa]